MKRSLGAEKLNILQLRAHFHPGAQEMMLLLAEMWTLGSTEAGLLCGWKTKSAL